jgi:ADP-heptose:LPS heptosyltransferase
MSIRSPTIISCISHTQLGDSVCSLPVAGYIKKIFPNSYSVAVLDPRTKELAPLLINHPDIDRIYISHKAGGYTEEENQWVATFDFNLPLFGHYVPSNWIKTMSWVESNFRLRFQFEAISSPFSSNAWSSLTEDERKPKLKPWFDIGRYEKFIVICPFVGYNLSDETTRKRSPSLEWWGAVVKMILKMGFKVIQIGIPSHPVVYNDINFYDRRDISLLESVKLALGADLFLGACGGVSVVINAYGQKTICPFTNWIKEAKLENLLPVNYKNNMIPILGKDDINIISLDEVERAILQHG